MNRPGHYLLDTNVVSETRKMRPDSRVLHFLASVSASSMFLSVLTLGELRRGVAAKRQTDPGMAATLGEWVDGVESHYSDRVLPVDAATATCWGELTGQRRLPVVDTLIAATALTHGLTLVTRNTRDVEPTAVSVFDPWTYEADL